MNIPEKVKVGGKTYTVEITDKLYMGRQGYNGEILTDECVIRIAPGRTDDDMKAVFLHELTHALGYFMGYNNHDEEKVERIAEAILMLIKDNPNIFASEVEKKEE